MRKIYLLLIALCCFNLVNAEPHDGEPCGINMDWVFYDGTQVLFLQGSGAMYDYTGEKVVPWAEYCNQIKEIDYERGEGKSTFTSIGAGAFSDCVNLESVDIPATVTLIGESAFNSDTKLKSFTFHEGMKIGNFAFYRSGLTTVTIPADVTIGVSTFAKCSNLTTFIVDENNKKLCASGGVLYSNDKQILYNFPPADIMNRSAYTISDVTTQIGNSAFAYSKLTDVTIPATVTIIGSEAFAEMPNLKTLTCYATTPPVIYGNTFEETDISSATLYVPYGMENAYSKADGWRNFGSIKTLIPTGKCGDNITWTFNTSTKELVLTGTGAVNDYIEVEAPWTPLAEFIVGLKIGKNITSIGERAFYNLYALTTVSGMEDVVCIADEAFAWSGIENIPLGDKVETIGTGAFHACGMLAGTINIGPKVASIGSGAFTRCHNITSFAVNANNEKYIGYQDALYSADMRVLLVYPAGKTEETLAIPDGVRTIAQGALTWSDFLKEISIPASVETMENDNFSYMYKLSKVYSLATLPPVTTDVDCFYLQANATLYVPKGAVADYTTAVGWDNFGTIVEIEKEAIPQTQSVQNDANSKIIRQGQLIIRKNGKLYNVVGTELK